MSDLRSKHVPFSLSSGLALFSLALWSGCAKSVTMDFEMIRPAPDWAATDQFIQTHQFHSRSRPNIYFVFFDTLRPDLALARQGSMKRFYDHSWSFEKTYATGTATWYSLFSMFHGVPAFLTYDTFPKRRASTHEYGAVYLKTLKKLGYELEFYGSDWQCVTREPKKVTSWDWFKMNLYGYQSYLVQHCASDSQYDQVFSRNQDEETLAEVTKRLKQTVTTPEGKMVFIGFYNNHNPYKWAAAKSSVNQNVGEKEDFSEPRTIINRYKNSVVAADEIFGQLISTIDSLPGHDRAIVVLFSDHGEMLYEKKGESGHGGIPYQEKINTLLSFRFPENSRVRGKVETQSLASMIDIFPTIFDELDVQPAFPQEMLPGLSLLRYHRKSAISVQSNQSDPTRSMVLVNGTKKAWVHVDDDDFYHSRTLTLESVSDLGDSNSHQDCDQARPHECKSRLISEFPEAIHELYPSISTQVSYVRAEKESFRLPASRGSHILKKDKGKSK